MPKLRQGEWNVCLKGIPVMDILGCSEFKDTIHTIFVIPVKKCFNSKCQQILQDPTNFIMCCLISNFF